MHQILAITELQFDADKGAKNIQTWEHFEPGRPLMVLLDLLLSDYVMLIDCQKTLGLKDRPLSLAVYNERRKSFGMDHLKRIHERVSSLGGISAFSPTFQYYYRQFHKQVNVEPDADLTDTSGMKRNRGGIWSTLMPQVHLLEMLLDKKLELLECQKKSLK